jgi:hypothetical protein
MARFRDDDSGNEPHALGDGKIMRETDKAVLVRIGDKEIWVPKSCIHDDSEAHSLEANEGTVVVKRWWAEKNGYD